MEGSIAAIIQHYGYVGIFFSLCLGVIGLPIPDEVLMAFIGYMIYKGTLSFSLSLLSAFLGTMTGISISYLLGYSLGFSFIRKYGKKIYFTEKRLEQTQDLFQKYGAMLLTMGYFIPGVRHVSAYVAGMSKLRFTTFAIFAYVGALIWCLTFITLGLSLGKNWFMIAHLLRDYGWYAVLLLLLLMMAGILLRRMYLLRRKA